MRTRVLLFAALREAVGARELVIDLPDPATVAVLRCRLAADHPRLAPLVQNAAVAINEEYAREDHPIRDGDVIALIPPVSGG
jgi:molybdopterin converting factor subunit 1